MEPNPIYPDITLKTGKSPLKPIKGEYRYYDFLQNNSGGDFLRDENLGDHVLIAAKNPDDANDRLVSLGGYFDGVENGSDCSCCGDRWYPKWKSDKGTETPTLCEMMIPVYMQEFRWPGRQIVVHHPDGFKDTYILDGSDS